MAANVAEASSPYMFSLMGMVDPAFALTAHHGPCHFGFCACSTGGGVLEAGTRAGPDVFYLIYVASYGDILFRKIPHQIKCHLVCVSCVVCMASYGV